MIWAIIFWISVIAILHSYIIYPVILKLLAERKSNNKEVYSPDSELPFVSVIMSVYNEEKVIIEKLRSIGNTSYPDDKFEILIGSDGSTDKTDNILNLYSNDYASFRFFPFKERRGKPNVINSLREEARGEILIMTDAQVIFTPELIFQLVKHFKNKQIGLVGANIINQRVDKTGISYQEWTFMSREIKLKYMEGKAWGTMIGAYGACYAIRNELYSPVPSKYSVDDFYITMKVLARKYRCIMELDAIGHENVPNKLREEFRRKIRISAGNFQNLFTFCKLLWPPYTGLSFSFMSHKVIRWLGPFFLILAILSNIFLYNTNKLYEIALYIQGILVIIPLIDFLMRKIGLHVVFLRFITHFYSMNLALLAGFVKFLKGAETNVWQPTRRSER